MRASSLYRIVELLISSAEIDAHIHRYRGDVSVRAPSEKKDIVSFRLEDSRALGGCGVPAI